MAISVDKQRQKWKPSQGHGLDKELQAADVCGEMEMYPLPETSSQLVLTQMGQPVHTNNKNGVSRSYLCICTHMPHATMIIAEEGAISMRVGGTWKTLKDEGRDVGRVGERTWKEERGAITF